MQTGVYNNNTSGDNLLINQGIFIISKLEKQELLILTFSFAA